MAFKSGDEWNGNGKGRPRKPEVEVVRKAIEEVEAEKKIKFWKFAVQKAYEDNNVLNVFIKKFLPENIEVRSYEPIILIRSKDDADVQT